MVVKHFDTQNPRFATIKSSSFAGMAIACLFGEATGNRLLVQAEQLVAPSTTVTVEYEDALFLGEVITCRREDSVFTLEVKVEQVLSGLQSLMALRSRLLCDAPTTAPGISPLGIAQQNASAFYPSALNPAFAGR